MHTHFLYLRNGWADNGLVVLIRYVVGDESTDRFPQFIRGTFASQRTCNAHSLVHRQQGVILVVSGFIFALAKDRTPPHVTQVSHVSHQPI